MLEELLEDLGLSDEWETDGYGSDALLIHSECGELLEIDGLECGICKVPNPLIALGI
jgi:hypothetical protein